MTLSLSAADAGFVLGEPSSITTPFSFGALVVADADTVVTLSGPVPADATGISGEDLSLVYSYSADDLRDRTLMGNVDVVASVDGVAITPAVSHVDGVRGEITIILSRAEYPEPDEHELAVTLSLSAAAAGFVLGEPSSITTPFSFGALVVADADTVVTLSGPVPADATGISGEDLSLVYSYSADDLRGRTLMGNVDVVASVDGVAITPAVSYVDGVRGEITIILSRAEYPEPDESRAGGDPEPQRRGRGICPRRAELDHNAVQLRGSGCCRRGYGCDPVGTGSGRRNRHFRGGSELGLQLRRR